jgi:hypothetical protein
MHEFIIMIINVGNIKNNDYLFIVLIKYELTIIVCCLFTVGEICRNKSGWPSGLRRCVQVAVHSVGVGSNPTPDK